MYLTLIYDYFNVLTRIEERPTLERAHKAGIFWSKNGNWYSVVKPENNDEKEMYYAMLNM